MLDSIRVVSDGLSAINLRLADMLPSENGFDVLELQRDELNTRLRFLTRQFFQENTERFIEEEHDLAETNLAMKDALNGLENLQAVLTKVKRFVTAVNTFIETIFPGSL